MMFLLALVGAVSINAGFFGGAWYASRPRPRTQVVTLIPLGAVITADNILEVTFAGELDGQPSLTMPTLRLHLQ